MEKLFSHKKIREALAVLLIAIACYLLLSLISYHINDPSWSNIGFSKKHILNLGGSAGAWIADFLFTVFGLTAYLLPLSFLYSAWSFIYKEETPFAEAENNKLHWLIKIFGWILLFIAACSLCSIVLHVQQLPAGSGGILGILFSGLAKNAFGLIGASIIMSALLLIGLSLSGSLCWLTLLELLGRAVLFLLRKIAHATKKLLEKLIAFRKRKTIVKTPAKREKKRAEQVEKKENKKDFLQKNDVSQNNSSGPSLSLLDLPSSNKRGYSQEELERLSKEVEIKLKDFNIDAEVTAVYPGPVITRFELQLAAGTKVSKISVLAKDLARSLSVVSVRIVEVIPGKSVIGLELPNEYRETVKLREILSSKQYRHAHSPLNIALGKDISGHPVVADLAKMPHLLVAGTTGSGKSVGLNAIILSLLYKYSQKELRLLMIDPKMLELSVYEGIPHLLTPVVTNMKEAANALRWCVAEMEKRYRLMASLGVRNIIGYNKKVIEARRNGNPIMDPLWQSEMDGEQEELQELPYIVVIADEFADMIMVVGKKVEELIARIAQKARAAGIHLILATQRPSVDVITGLIKANIPSRIAFQVSSRVDSRTILDQSGAEQLLGSGDMLYLPPGTTIPTRVHGAFVTDEEVHNVARDLKKKGRPNYVKEVLDAYTDNGIPGIDTNLADNDDPEKDEFYDRAVAFVLETRRVSISSIQRKFKIGYNRAARIVEAMETAGLVSAMQSNGGREILLPNE